MLEGKEGAVSRPSRVRAAVFVWEFISDYKVVQGEKSHSTEACQRWKDILNTQDIVLSLWYLQTPQN